MQLTTHRPPLGGRKGVQHGWWAERPVRPEGGPRRRAFVASGTPSPGLPGLPLLLSLFFCWSSKGSVDQTLRAAEQGGACWPSPAAARAAHSVPSWPAAAEPLMPTRASMRTRSRTGGHQLWFARQLVHPLLSAIAVGAGWAKASCSSRLLSLAPPSTAAYGSAQDSAVNSVAR